MRRKAMSDAVSDAVTEAISDAVSDAISDAISVSRLLHNGNRIGQMDFSERLVRVGRFNDPRTLRLLTSTAGT